MQEFTGLEYLKIDIANLFGLDKKTWQERLSWFNENQDNLYSLIDQADEPCQFFAAIKNYEKAINGEVCYKPIALDATFSGLQWFSVLTCDRKSAEYCNVLNTGTRMDAYTVLYKKMESKIGVNPLITRQKVKDAIMHALYGSIADPENLFQEHVDSFYALMEQECPLAWELNNFLTSSWNPNISEYGWIMPDNFHVHIKVKVLKTETFIFAGKERIFNYKETSPNSYGRAYSANVAHSLDSLAVREITALAMHNPKQIAKIKALLKNQGKKRSVSYGNKKNRNMVLTLVELFNQSGFLSARILDYIDEDNINLIPRQELEELVALVPAKPFQIASIHDSFGVLPNYGNDIRKLYIAILVKVAKSNMLQFILDQLLSEKKVKIRKGDPEMWKDVQNSEYALS